ncbi:ankyrin repeat and SOCS box protein 17-like [Centruroides vittatus]
MLHHAAKLCYYWWLSNSNLVCQVLYRIYRLESHFPIVYNHVVTNGEPQTDDWPIPIARCNVEPNEYARIIYFLRHANNCKMTINGVRFPDLPTSSVSWLPPWISAVLKSKPTLLQLLLQHGSILESDNDLPVDICKYYSNPSHYFRNTISMLWSNNINSLSTEYIVNDEQLQRSILIIKLLLRIIPQLQPRDLRFRIVDMTEIRSFVSDLSERGIICNLRERYWRPSELRHLCRCVIRRHLRKMWKLPLGIFQLPLPNRLRKYLNLEDD